MVNLDGGQFRCHACGSKGGVLDALQLLGVYDRDEARRLAVEYGIEGVGRRRSRKPLPGVHRGPPTPTPQQSKPKPRKRAARPEKAARIDWTAPLPQREPERAWVYHGPDGAAVGRVCLMGLTVDGKKIVESQRWNGTAFVSGLDGKRLPLYRLPDVLARARKGGRVIVVEGEKCVHALDKIGLLATTNPGGAGKWWPEYTRALRGASVVVFADCDHDGRMHAIRVTQELRGAGVTVSMPVDVAPYEQNGFDIYDELAAVAETIRRVPPDVPAATLPYRIRWMLLDHVYAKYLRAALPANADALREKMERMQAAVSQRPLLHCDDCGQERPHRIAAGLAYCPCGAFRPMEGGQSEAA
jgi:5S rRNA maturation endonuclease (ribonuclease M5)